VARKVSEYQLRWVVYRAKRLASVVLGATLLASLILGGSALAQGMATVEL
jgi:hypothetical protein